MKIKPVLFIPLLVLLVSCGNKSQTMEAASSKNKQELSCKLTSSEMQKRRETVLAVIQKQVLEKKELPDGYSFKFNGTDTAFDYLADFIKSERQCCDFFTFTLKASDEKSFIWLDITGPAGAKDFIKTELEL